VRLAICLVALLAVACWGGAAQSRTLRVCTGCNFASQQLAGSDYSGVVYVGTNFAGATLERASFRGAKLVAANFAGADLRAAAFDGVECTACNFVDAKLDGASFGGALIVAANFKGFAAAIDDAELRALLSGCVSCNFSAGSLTGRDLSGLAMISVDFSSADLRGTKFDGSVLCWYVADGARRTANCDKMQGARVDGASFAGVLLCADPTDKGTCAVVDAASLRRYSGSDLNGAVLP
jgi:uncharacterized protein YjbI with pentapeptide repeats